MSARCKMCGRYVSDVDHHLSTHHRSTLDRWLVVPEPVDELDDDELDEVPA